MLIFVSLKIATNHLTYFEKLSSLFMRIGTSWALHEDFAQLFPRSETLQTYFCEYLIVLMTLCNKIIVFSTRSTSSQVFSSIGVSFDSEFGMIEKELNQWGLLIQQSAQIQATRVVNGTEMNRIEGLKQHILRLLSPHQAEFVSRWRRQRKLGTCQWVFDTPSFLEWKSMQSSTALCVTGNLGTGKTVSMANIVARTAVEHQCAYAFCASLEPSSLKARDILGTTAFHLIDSLPEGTISWTSVEGIVAQISTFDTEGLVDFILGLLPEDRRYFIVLDGLEDVPDADLRDVLLGLCRLMKERVILLCYSSRSHSRFSRIADEQLTPRLTISHEDLKHENELEAYIVEELIRRNATGTLTPDLLDLVKQQLLVGAQGMSVLIFHICRSQDFVSSSL